MTTDQLAPEKVASPFLENFWDSRGMVGILMAQCRPGALRLPPVVLDFWTSAYQAIDD